MPQLFSRRNEANKFAPRLDIPKGCQKVAGGRSRGAEESNDHRESIHRWGAPRQGCQIQLGTACQLPVRLSLLLIFSVSLTIPILSQTPAPSINEILAAQQDLWCLAAMRQPDGPSYEFFERLL